MVSGSASNSSCGNPLAQSGDPLIFQPALATHPRWVSRIWPMFIRRGTPWVFRMMSTGVPSGRNGMSSTGRILPMTPLLPWRAGGVSPALVFRFSVAETRDLAVAAGELVTVLDLALLGDVDADQLVDARRQLVLVVAREDADADDLAVLA